jgi:hypothetical protein
MHICSEEPLVVLQGATPINASYPVDDKVINVLPTRNV